jgi:hypothetical protein
MNRVASGLRAGVRLAQGRADGAGLLASGEGTLAASFWAVALCVPMVLFPALFDASGGGWADRAHAGGQQVLIFVVGWLAFVEATRLLAEREGRAGHWRRFVVVWNWCNVVEGAIIVAGEMPRILGAPEMVSQVSALVTIGWALWIEWFAIRVGFGITTRAAIGLLVLDQAIGVLLGALASAVSP